MVQKGKFSAVAALLVKTLKNVDFLKIQHKKKPSENTLNKAQVLNTICFVILL
jgi:hypothetical protein